MNILALIINSFIKACKIDKDTKIHPVITYDNWYYDYTSNEREYQ